MIIISFFFPFIFVCTNVVIMIGIDIAHSNISEHFLHSHSTHSLCDETFHLAGSSFLFAHCSDSFCFLSSFQSFLLFFFFFFFRKPFYFMRLSESFSIYILLTLCCTVRHLLTVVSFSMLRNDGKEQPTVAIPNCIEYQRYQDLMPVRCGKQHIQKQLSKMYCGK